MKKSILVIIFIFSFNSTAFCAPSLTSSEMKKILTNNTFQVQYHNDSMPDVVSHVFFSDNGQLTSQLKQSIQIVKFIKTGSWEFKEKDLLCVKFKRRKKNFDLRLITCGIVLVAGKNIYRHYNEEGKLYATLMYLGAGNQLN